MPGADPTTTRQRRDPAATPIVAGDQSGVFSRDQARAEGWSDAQIRRRVSTGRWRPVAGGALTAGGTAITPLVLAWAAHLTRPDCVVSHVTAAGLHGLPVPPDDRAHVVSGVRRSAANGIRVHRGVLEPGDVQLLDGVLPVTSPRRSVVDCLAGLPFDDGLRLWAFASTRGLLDRAQLAAATRARLGSKGNPALLRILRRTSTGALSEAELRLHHLLRSSGVRGWTANATVRDGEGVIGVVDILFADQRVVVEVDGWAAHGGRAAFVDDRRRQNRLIAAGYVVLRLTWADIVDRGAEVVAQLQRVLALHEPTGRSRRMGS